MGVRGLSSYVTGCQRACSEHVELNADETDDGAAAAYGADVSTALMRRDHSPEYT